jgi:hypothetical protein
MADQGSLADVVQRAATRASTRTLVLSALSGLLALILVFLWALIGHRERWVLPFAAGALSAVAFGLGGLAHQRLLDEEHRGAPDFSRLTTLRLVQRASVLIGAAGAVIFVGRILMELYGSNFWN